MELSLTDSVVDGVTVVTVEGEMDVYTSPTLRDRLSALLDDGTSTVVVDLSAVTFLDSTGIGTLVGALKRAEEQGGGLPVVCPQDRLLKLFRITGLDGVFTIRDTVAEAVAAP